MTEEKEFRYSTSKEYTDELEKLARSLLKKRKKENSKIEKKYNELLQEFLKFSESK